MGQGIINVITNTCDFLAMPSLNVCIGKGLWSHTVYYLDMASRHDVA